MIESLGQRLLHIFGYGSLLSVMPNKQHDAAINAEEFRDNIQLCYGLQLLHLPDCCNGCGSGFSVEHALNCKNGGLVDFHHNEDADEWASLCGIALTPTCISCDPTIFTGEEAESMKNQSKQQLPPSDANSSKKNKNKSNKAYAGAKGDKGVIGFWKRGCMCVFDIQITDTESKSYGGQDSQKSFQQNGKNEIR